MNNYETSEGQTEISQNYHHSSFNFTTTGLTAESRILITKSGHQQLTIEQIFHYPAGRFSTRSLHYTKPQWALHSSQEWVLSYSHILMAYSIYTYIFSCNNVSTSDLRWVAISFLVLFFPWRGLKKVVFVLCFRSLLFFFLFCGLGRDEHFLGIY